MEDCYETTEIKRGHRFCLCPAENAKAFLLQECSAFPVRFVSVCSALFSLLPRAFSGRLQPQGALPI